MPSNLNDRVPREQAKIPNVRNWAVRDYGNRVGIWRLMEVLTRYGIRASAALNSEVCDHPPEIIEEGGKLRWKWIGHNQTNALRWTRRRRVPQFGPQSTVLRRPPAHARSAGSAPAWRKPGIRSITSRKPVSVMSATGSTMTKLHNCEG
jgi:allantoinase